MAFIYFFLFRRVITILFFEASDFFGLLGFEENLIPLREKLLFDEKNIENIRVNLIYIYMIFNFFFINIGDPGVLGKLRFDIILKKEVNGRANYL